MTISFPEIPARRSQQLLASVLRTSLKLLVKPLFNGRTPVPVMRTGLRAVAATTLPARGVHRDSVSLGGVTAERWRPASGASEAVVLYLHGGAYCVGSPATHRSLTSHLSRASGATVLVVDYRLAPEHPCPAALDDALSAYQALLEEGVMPDQIIIAGDSAGGGLTLATALALRDAGQPAPAGLIMLSPWVDLTHPRAGTPVSGEAMLQWAALEKAAELYCADQRRDVRASPLHGTLHALPSSLIITGTDEILLGDSEALEAALDAAGGQVDLLLYTGMWHVFPAHAGVLDTADHAILQMADFIRTKANL
ncbi:alpha/beta hydrolase [Isoalcanivorax indicus]|uniref:alpha/beta hydrolase n=1 Tax=Isoalcanivorax indicus TaxID=2202653 RepID=UPI000DB93CBF|nr:alpha/beta hydrolase [Isoalcanivorax indicus]